MPPTDHEFNDYSPSRAMQEALQKAKNELLDNSTAVVEPKLQAELDELMSSTLGQNLTEVIDAERIEEFQPLGLINGPLLRIDTTGLPTELHTCRPTDPCPACRQRLGQRLGQQDSAEPRTLLQIVGTHRALAGASALEVAELVAVIEARQTTELAAVAAEIQQFREQTMRATHLGWASDYNPQSKDAVRAGERWDQQYPALAALLQAVDGD
jgi:hypothetical protein